MRTFILGMILTHLAGGIAMANDFPSTADDAQVIKAAREKTYAGGRDEEDLEVQTQVIKPVRKIGNSQENVDTSVSDDEF